MTALLMPLGVLATAAPALAQEAPVGQGFNLSQGDLDFILRQIRISERHVETATAADPCGTLLGTAPDQIPNSGTNGDTLPLGLRTVDGSCNNLVPGQYDLGAADTVFPRRVGSAFDAAEPVPPGFPGGPPGTPTSYTQTAPGNVVIDSEPRTVSNLIVDQTADNPAAVVASNGEPADPTGTLPIPNVAPDVGLSAPFNGWFTIFGQFFDHGLDLVTKGGGTVFVPLKADDPLRTVGPDRDPNTPDAVPPHLAFMVLTRATNQPGGAQEHTNTTTSFVDQNQTYTSHPSHQAFLRAYANDGAGDPQPTGGLLNGPGVDSMATWADVKAQARTLLGIELGDLDALNVPMLATDAYGRFLPGANGNAQLATTAGLVEGVQAPPGGQGIPTTDAIRTGHAFLDDIAHHAVPFGDHDNNPGTPPQPRTPDADAGTTDDGDPATYDDEMLNAHFVAGDGRTNENIALTAVHQVFHSEHNRLRADIDAKIQAMTPEKQLEWERVDDPGSGWDYGERLFQAARFVTEMEYQHLVFEEFARKVQPLVNPFGEGGTGYNTTVDPSIKAEFAHAVYRFGHSMLTDTVARTNANLSNNDIGLIEAFLNPPEYLDGGTAGPLTPRQAAASIVRGMTRQVGQEIDEFVIEALRNNLLGLPLDLATINITRARDTGIPTLNEARRQFFADTSSSSLQPYSSWTDFGFALRHRDSLVNFIAAYGTHPTILTDFGADGAAGGGDDGPPTLQSRRAAAESLIRSDLDGEPPSAEFPQGVRPSPADSIEFMNSGPDGPWATAPGAPTNTGVDDIDLWVGGLAEKQLVFGGLLGPTFNYVFELQMEELQFGDRFYYLSRTAGLNLLVQLEGNSFAELVQRNTDVTGLPADAFSRPDYIFEVGALGASGPITDDPDTLYNEADRSVEPGRDLTRMADGTLRYSGPAHVVFNGRDSATIPDKVHSSEGDDTVRGNAGDDRIEGGDGNDNVIGGHGDDIITDLNGDDVLKGGDGDDAIQSGQGFGGDLNQGGLHNDFIVGGNDAAETFGGPGNDFVFGGAGDDTVFGDDGDDWIEGGAGAFNLLQGDAGAPFADDPEGGHDVLDGDGGEQDFDAEGGDDVMLLGQGIQRAEGMLGFDWGTHKGDPAAANSDMAFTGLLPPSIDNLRDRFDLVEAASGWNLNDTLRGDDRVEADILGPADDPTQSHELTSAGIARINGLQALLGTGVTRFAAGNILLGGAGNDLIEGRGGDDRIDGDRWLNVQLRAPDVTTADAADRKLFDRLDQVRADVFADRIDPGDIEIVRTIETPPAAANEDTAVFSGTRDQYDITVAAGVVTVNHARPAGTVDDGVDTLTGVERLQFSDTTVTMGAPAAPTNVTATAGNGQATVTWTAPPATALPTTGFSVQPFNATTNAPIGAPRTAAATATSLVVTGLTNGVPVRFTVAATNAAGTGAPSASSNTVTPTGPPTLAGAPTIGTPVRGNASVIVNWTPPANTGNVPLTRYDVQVLNAAGTAQVGALRTAAATATSLNVTGLTNGTTYRFRVRAVNSVGNGPYSAQSVQVTPATVPGAPLTAFALSGALGGNRTASVNWSAPVTTGGSAITGYRVTALQLNAAGTVVATLPSAVLAPTARSFTFTSSAPVGTRFRFQVVAINAVGTGAPTTTAIVTPQ